MDIINKNKQYKRFIRRVGGKRQILKQFQKKLIIILNHLFDDELFSLIGDINGRYCNHLQYNTERCRIIIGCKKIGKIYLS